MRHFGLYSTDCTVNTRISWRNIPDGRRAGRGRRQREQLLHVLLCRLERRIFRERREAIRVVGGRSAVQMLKRCVVLLQSFRQKNQVLKHRLGAQKFIIDPMVDNKYLDMRRTARRQLQFYDFWHCTI